MGRIKKEIRWATGSYVLSVALLLGVVYLFLEKEGYSQSHFLLASFVVLALSIGWGAILASHFLAPQQEIEENLLHLTKEIIHELNIPLSTIEANSRLLRKHLKEEKLQKRLERIDASAKRLTKLYDSLVYAITKEMHTIEKEWVNLSEMIQERIGFFEQQKRNPFVLHLEPCWVRLDRIGFEQAFDNVVSNAMKYSPKASVIEVFLKEGVLELRDRGIGMSETELLRVHEKYYQVDSKREGDGIGLSLVKAYCDTEGIALEIRSQKEVGTTLLFRFNTYELEQPDKEI